MYKESVRRRQFSMITWKFAPPELPTRGGHPARRHHQDEGSAGLDQRHGRDAREDGPCQVQRARVQDPVYWELSSVLQEDGAGRAGVDGLRGTLQENLTHRVMMMLM